MGPENPSQPLPFVPSQPELINSLLSARVFDVIIYFFSHTKPCEPLGFIRIWHQQAQEEAYFNILSVMSGRSAHRVCAGFQGIHWCMAHLPKN